MINAYLTDTITIQTVTLDTWGTATKVSTTAKARFEFRTKLVRNIAGEQVISTAKVYLPIMTITHQDKIVYETKEYSILNIERVKDFSAKFIKLDLA